MKKFILKRKSWYLIILLIILLFLIYLFIFKPSFTSTTFNWLEKMKQEIIKGDNYNDGIIDNSNLSQDEIVKLYNNYLVEGLGYKASGDAGNKAEYNKAIASFQKAIDLTEGKFWIPIVNVANIYKTIGDYDRSEEYYNQALATSNYSDQSIYLAKIDLYRNYLKEGNDKIINIYNEALDRIVLDRDNIVLSYASFLNDIGRYEESLKYYQEINSKFPDNQAIKQKIQEIRNIIEQNR